MSKKIIFKVVVLCFGLVMVVFGVRFFSSIEFQKNAETVFVGDVRAYQWCSIEKGFFHWNDVSLQAKFQNLSASSLAKRFCTLKIETIQGIDIKTLTWARLAEGLDQQGEKVLLEWNEKYKVFRADGLPFKSSSFSRELEQ